MNHTELMLRLCYDNIRIGEVIFLGGALVAEEALPKSLERFISEDIWYIDKNTFPCDIPLNSEEDEDREEFVIRWITDNSFFGFLLRVDTPIVRPEDITLYSDGEILGRSYTWDDYKYKWFYDDNFYKAIEKGIDWVDDVMDKAVMVARHLQKEGK